MSDYPGDLESVADESLADIEALIRAAGDYVRPSDDLRPRVLENARAVGKERRVQRWIAHLATVALAVALLATAVRRSPEMGLERFEAPSSYGLLWTAQEKSNASDASWSMVDSFTELRRQQAELLRPAL